MSALSAHEGRHVTNDGLIWAKLGLELTQLKAISAEAGSRPKWMTSTEVSAKFGIWGVGMIKFRTTSAESGPNLTASRRS